MIFCAFGCASGPTRTFEKSEGRQSQALAKIQQLRPDEIDLAKVVIVDTRPRFEYELAKVPRSFRFEPGDWPLFSLRGPALVRQTQNLQRRLALRGVTPYTPLVIFGTGPKGRGEEHYAAVLFSALGVQSISISSPRSFGRAMMARQNIIPLANVSYWQKPLQHNVSCQKKANGEVRRLVRDENSYHSYRTWLELTKKNKGACVDLQGGLL